MKPKLNNRQRLTVTVNFETKEQYENCLELCHLKGKYLAEVIADYIDDCIIKGSVPRVKPLKTPYGFGCYWKTITMKKNLNAVKMQDFVFLCENHNTAKPYVLTNFVTNLLK